jgi:hypothetical protein
MGNVPPESRSLVDQLALALLTVLAIAAVLLIAEGGQALSPVTVIVVIASAMAIAGVAQRDAHGIVLVWVAFGALLGVAVVSLLGAGFAPFLMALVLIGWLAASPHLRGRPRITGARLVAQVAAFVAVVLVLMIMR